MSEHLHRLRDECRYYLTGMNTVLLSGYARAAMSDFDNGKGDHKLLDLVRRDMEDTANYLDAVAKQFRKLSTATFDLKGDLQASIDKIEGEKS